MTQSGKHLGLLLLPAASCLVCMDGFSLNKVALMLSFPIIAAHKEISENLGVKDICKLAYGSKRTKTMIPGEDGTVS